MTGRRLPAKSIRVEPKMPHNQVKSDRFHSSGVRPTSKPKITPKSETLTKIPLAGLLKLKIYKHLLPHLSKISDD